MKDAQKTEYLAALKMGDVESISELLDDGCPVSFKIGSKKRWWPPLFEAIRFGHPDLVSLLIERGADPNGAHHYATHLGDRVTPLLLACSTYSSLFKVDQPDAFRIVELLLDAGADPNIAQLGGILEGETPLIVAVRDGRNLELVERLLAAGADPHAHSLVTSVAREAGKPSVPSEIRALIATKTNPDI